jgi:hypothetical protein
MGRAGGGGAGSPPATPAPACAGFASGPAPARAGQSPSQSNRRRCGAVALLSQGGARCPDRGGAARTSACSLAGLWRAGGKSRRHNPSGVGLYKRGLWALRAATMAPARAPICRPRARRRPPRGLVSLGSRRCETPSRSPPGSRGCGCFTAPPSSDHPLGPAGRQVHVALPQRLQGGAGQRRERALGRGANALGPARLVAVRLPEPSVNARRRGAQQQAKPKG